MVLPLPVSSIWGGVPVSLGVTPKLQKTWIYNYTTSIYDYDSNKWNDSRYRKDDTGFNVGCRYRGRFRRELDGRGGAGKT
ncbi:conjugative transfer protein [Enterobacter cloacae]|uniref:Conjugative transfer protein n=1 Tax=Enterobacter cloacae TaxID=550 RepID=A0A377LP62_ENTCL|nr:conjugative transfer protein [Enterobacter cloacae]